MDGQDKQIGQTSKVGDQNPVHSVEILLKVVLTEKMEVTADVAQHMKVLAADGRVIYASQICVHKPKTLRADIFYSIFESG